MDGNERTGVATCLVFLSENALLTNEKLDADAWEELTLGVAAGELDGVAAFLLLAAADLVGDAAYYSLGRFGHAPFVERIGKWLALTPERLAPLALVRETGARWWGAVRSCGCSG